MLQVSSINSKNIFFCIKQKCSFIKETPAIPTPIPVNIQPLKEPTTPVGIPTEVMKNMSKVVLLRVRKFVFVVGVKTNFQNN